MRIEKKDIAKFDFDREGLVKKVLSNKTMMRPVINTKRQKL
ncbi:hypothetical protein [uncultured Sphaerochaeta sp.]|nr:hypothetical protein [uncultured Sphaerochaeta sp.]